MDNSYSYTILTILIGFSLQDHLTISECNLLDWEVLFLRNIKCVENEIDIGEPMEVTTEFNRNENDPDDTAIATFWRSAIATVFSSMCCVEHDRSM